MLRFKKDDGTSYPEWERKKLSEICDVRDGTHDSPRYTIDGYPFITSKNLTESGTIDFENINYISKEDYEMINKRSKVDIGDLLFGMIGTIGKPVIVKKDGFAIKNVALIKPQYKVINNYYLYNYFQSNCVKRQFLLEEKGGTQKFLALGVIRNINVLLPCLEEQQKIADFLSEVDNIIAMSEKEIESLEMQKKGAMQKIFSQEVRFKADDGSEYPEWEEKILGDICELITKGTTPKDYSNNPEDINYIKIESIVANKICLDKCTKIEKTIHEGVLKRSILKEGDILFAIAGSLGTMAVVEKNMLPANTNQALAIIRLNKECCSQYIYTVLSSTVMTQYIKQCCTIGAQPNLSLKQMNDFAFPYPCLEEQQKIADFLSEFDNAIEYAKEELEVWKNIKKGLLQQMFE